MMALDSKIILFAITSALLFLLTAVAGYACFHIGSLSLPISRTLVLLTIFLPPISGLANRGLSALLRRGSNNLTIPIVVLLWLQIIYETVVATLALTNLIPSSTLNCRLNDQWLALFRAKNEDAIKAIQDKFDCCGFNSIKHMNWPFPPVEPSTCGELYHRTRSCVGPWRKAQQINAGLLLLVAVVVFIIKVISITSLLTNNSWTRSRWGRPFKAITSASDEEDHEDNNRVTTGRLIEDSAADEGYHDNPSEEAHGSAGGNATGIGYHGPRVVVSGLGEGGSEWRDEGQAK